MRRLIAALLLLLASVLWLPASVRSADPGCRPYPKSNYSPTGIVGCHEYGIGIASWYTGPGAARNDCVWPWKHCQPISIRSLDTDKTIIVTPVMYCDCYTGTPNQRLVDLTPALVKQLGLKVSTGLYRVEVEPVDQNAIMPNTACEDCRH